MERDEEMFSAKRKSVSSNRVVGNTLNSTARRMYSEISRTSSESMMLAEINTSSRKGGIGAIITRTIPKTATGTLMSWRLASFGAARVAGARAFVISRGKANQKAKGKRQKAK